MQGFSRVIHVCRDSTTSPFPHHTVQLVPCAPLCLRSVTTRDLNGLIVSSRLQLLQPRRATHRKRVGTFLYNKALNKVGEDRRLQHGPRRCSAALAVLRDAAGHRGRVVPGPGGHGDWGRTRIQHRHLLRTTTVQTMNHKSLSMYSSLVHASVVMRG